MPDPQSPQQANGLARVTFVAGARGEWHIHEMKALRGAPLPAAQSLSRVEHDSFAGPGDASWVLQGVRSNERYLERAEKERLVVLQQGLGRTTSRHAALIPIRKADAWWDLAQDQRRAVFEARSHHIEIGARYLPAIARRLYHCRDLGQPFDFLTWFEFSASDEGAFDDLLGHLRATEEWQYVAREVEIRLRLT